MPSLTSRQVKDIILKQLPILIKKDEEVKAYIIHLIEKISAPKKHTEDRFDQLLEEIHQLRDEGNRKWEAWEKKWGEEKAENQKKWEENQKKSEEWEKKWEENQKVIREMMAEIKSLNHRYYQGIGAIGERWGFHAEGTFRNALGSILSEITNYSVSHFEERDNSGEVFGYPENIEIDLIISNGKTFITEIKASCSDGEMWHFKKKADWWEKQKNIKPDGLIVISPMIHPKARKIAERFGIRCFSYAEDVFL